jgi:hypothetical protein
VADAQLERRLGLAEEFEFVDAEMLEQDAKRGGSRLAHADCGDAGWLDDADAGIDALAACRILNDESRDPAGGAPADDHEMGLPGHASSPPRRRLVGRPEAGKGRMHNLRKPKISVAIPVSRRRPDSG